jgi:magnesium chelatase family protein
LLELETASCEASAKIAARVEEARQRQARRFARSPIHCNAQIGTRQLGRHLALSRSLRQLLARYGERHQLSARALHRACRVARTLADLDRRSTVADEDVLCALTMQQARWVT